MPSLWNIVLNTPRNAMGALFGDNPSETIANAAVAMAFFVAGIVGCYIILKIGEYFSRSNSNQRFEYDQRTKRYKETTRRSRQNLIRFISIMLGILVLLFACWIGGNSAGFNFWTVIFGYGIMSLVGTYAFGSTLQNAGAFLLISLTDKIETGWYVKLPGAAAEGRIKSIHIIWIELEYEDLEAKAVREIHIPTAFFIAQVVWRLFDKEAKYRELDKKDQLYPNSKFAP